MFYMSLVSLTTFFPLGHKFVYWSLTIHGIFQGYNPMDDIVLQQRKFCLQVLI